MTHRAALAPEGDREASTAARPPGRPALRWLGRVECATVVAAMQDFTAARDAATADQIWLCEHLPVYTQGLAGRPEHLFDPGTIPVLQTNRGGQVTYHGPGQVVAYPLVDLRRLRLHVKAYVHRLERALLSTLEAYGVTGHRVAGAPGVYVRPEDPFSHAALDARTPAERQRAGAGPAFEGLAKIAALGIKVSRHCAYHGVALNVAMDLEPYSRIDPCGYAGLRTVDLSTIGVEVPVEAAAETLGARLASNLTP